MIKQTSWFQRCQVYCNLDEAWCGILDVLRWQRALAGLTPPLSSAIFSQRILKNQTRNFVPEIEQLKRKLKQRNITIWRHDGGKFRPSRKRPFSTDKTFIDPLMEARTKFFSYDIYLFLSLLLLILQFFLFLLENDKTRSINWAKPKESDITKQSNAYFMWVNLLARFVSQ